MSESDYYERVAELQHRLSRLIKRLTEAQEIISPCPKGREDYPGLIYSTPKKKQRELLNNMWIGLKYFEDNCVLGSEIDELLELLNDVGNCPIDNNIPCSQR